MTNTARLSLVASALLLSLFAVSACSDESDGAATSPGPTTPDVSFPEDTSSDGGPVVPDTTATPDTVTEPDVTPDVAPVPDVVDPPDVTEDAEPEPDKTPPDIVSTTPAHLEG